MSPFPIKPSNNRFRAATDGFREFSSAGLRSVPESEPPFASSNSNRVLILEDDTALSELLAAFLTENGFEVVPVRNGVEGVHQVLKGDFEVILCDLMMPALPGDMFFRAVGRMRPHLCERFIFMTGHGASPNVDRLVASANNAVLAKPFEFNDLLELIAFIRVRNIQLAA
jgi:DNA-binding response OmpR family regulator